MLCNRLHFLRNAFAGAVREFALDASRADCEAAFGATMDNPWGKDRYLPEVLVLSAALFPAECPIMGMQEEEAAVWGWGLVKAPPPPLSRTVGKLPLAAARA